MCDDGGAGSHTSICDYGTDCDDCPDRSPETDASLTDPPPTGDPENPILSATIANPQSISLGQLREDIASASETEAGDNIIVDSYNPISGELQFTISGNDAQAAGEKFLSLDNAALTCLPPAKVACLTLS